MIAVGMVKALFAVVAIGLGFVVIVAIMALQAQPMRQARMLLLRGRVLRIEPPTSESGADAVIELASVMRLRPDGLVRPVAVGTRPQKLGVSNEVYEELRAQPESWPDRGFVAGPDRFVLATVETARLRI